MLPPANDRPKLAHTLDDLAAAVEELLQGGLTTVSESTRQTISVALQEAARARLFRLGATLRTLGEELGRFARQDPAFSRRRLSFFLGRSWILSRGLARALHEDDEYAYDRLAWVPPSEPVAEVRAVCLGAAKKVAPGSIVAFDFRLRALADAGPIREGGRLTWSFIFPAKPGSSIPPEGYLHLPQKQKFAPILLLERAVITLTDAVVTADGEGNARIAASESSKVATATPFDDWPRFLEWSPEGALERIASHQPGPLDVETELQEEVILRDYSIGPPAESDEPGGLAYPITAGPIAFHAVVGPGVEGQALAKSLDGLRKPRAARPPLFGLMHYERCRLVLLPLTTFGENGPDYLTISKENVDKAALLKAMTFT
jgi:hypothetical protein